MIDDLTPDRTLPGCADTAVGAGEQPIGNASWIRSWLLVEHPGPWPVDVRERLLLDLLPDASRPELERLWVEEGLRPLIVRRVGDRRREIGARTVMFGCAVPGRRWSERLQVDRLEDVLDLDLARIATGDPGIGEPVANPLWLVCTHGQKDLCCAVHGRPVAQALDAVLPEVWECTHVGGDRFAGNLLVLPHGLMYGHLDPGSAVATATAVAAGRVPLDGLRGRSTAPPPAQVAEALVRRETGLDGLDDVAAHEVVEMGADRWTVEVTGGGTTFQVAVSMHAGDEAVARCTAFRPRRWAAALR